MKRATILFLLFLAISVSAQPLIIAHRGSMAYAPENTMTAFKKAIELGADALELDLQQTKDGQLVVIHDASINRTTNGEGDIEDIQFDDLRKLAPDIPQCYVYALRLPWLGMIIDTGITFGSIFDIDANTFSRIDFFFPNLS